MPTQSKKDANSINVDIHCHVFNAADIPIRGFVRHVALHDGLMSPQLAAIATRLVSGAPGFESDKARLDRILSGGEERAPAAPVDIEATYDAEVMQAVSNLSEEDRAVIRSELPPDKTDRSLTEETEGAEVASVPSSTTAPTAHPPAKQPCGCGCGGACDYGPFSRNNYWYGKLMLPQDFTDEQTYLRDKIRHAQPAAARYRRGLRADRARRTPSLAAGTASSTSPPGLALDCCGNEIVVPDLLRVDITALPAVQALDPSDDATHELQLRFCYRECPTEPVPVLYDECGCDDGRCLPNRILESYDVEVIVDPLATADTWTGPALVRDTDIALAEARHVRVVGGLLYVAVDSTLYQVDPASRATLGSYTLSGSVLALEGAADGSAVFVGSRRRERRHHAHDAEDRRPLSGEHRRRCRARQRCRSPRSVPTAG